MEHCKWNPLHWIGGSWHLRLARQTGPRDASTKEVVHTRTADTAAGGGAQGGVLTKEGPRPEKLVGPLVRANDRGHLLL